MKKVLEFTDSLSDGGAETLIKDYALLIDKSKFNLKIISIYMIENTANCQVLQENCVPITYIFKKWTLIRRILHKFFRVLYISSKFLKIIKEEKPDCIHVHMALLKYFCPIRKKIKDIPIYYTCHSLPERYFDGQNKDEFIAAQKLFEENKFRIIALHNEMAMQINKMFCVNNTAVIRNGIVYSRFCDIPETKNEIRQSLGIKQDEFVIGHVGRFADVKNHSFLIEIFEEIVKCKSNSHLLLVGHGPLKEEMLNKIQKLGLINHVTVLEHRTDIPRILKSMDAFVFPSKFEGLGIALIEAQVVGLRCYASNTIPQDVMISSLLTFLPLKEGGKYWAEVIANDKKTDVKKYENYANYNMENEIRRLEALYNGDNRKLSEEKIIL